MFHQKTIWDERYQLGRMASGSMEPALMAGDILVIDKDVDPATLNASTEGDIIAFYDPRYEKDSNHKIVHRAISKAQNNGEWYFETKGDNNFASDRWYGSETWDGKISERLLIGKIVEVNPPLTITYQSLLLWLIAALAIGSGVSSLVVFVLTRKSKS